MTARFLICAGWAIWHTLAYILDFLPQEKPGLIDQMFAQHLRKDVTSEMSGRFGGYADPRDWAAMI